MLQKLSTSALALIIAGGLAACGQNDESATMSDAADTAADMAADTSIEQMAVAEDQRLTTYLDGIFDREVAQSPSFQSQLGVDLGGLDKWDDTSDVYRQKEIAEREGDLTDLTANFDRDALSEDGKLSYDIAGALFEADNNEDAFNRHVYVTDQFRGQFMDPITLLQNNHRVSSVKDAENYIARLNGIEGLMGDMVARLNDRAAFGVIAPAFAFPPMITDISSVLTGAPLDDSDTDHPLYADFKTKVDALDIDDAAKADLVGRAAAAMTTSFKNGYSALLAETKRLSTMQDENNGVWALPDGKAFYEMRVKRFTTLDQTADEIHQVGLADVKRIHGEIQAIMDQIEFDGSLQDFFAFIRTDPNNFYSNDDAGREAFLKDASDDTARIFAVADQYFHTLPKAELEIRRVESWRENSTSIAFYNRPSQDGSRPGIYYANLADMTAVQKYIFRSITFHEGTPGHHFQIARMQEMEGLPKIRKFRSQSVFTEGWGLYSEQLASEMGMSGGPLYTVGRLQSELWRAVRLVVDTGIHSKKWTRQQSIDYFLENTPISEQDIVTEVERFFVLPGQALSYKTGMITILALREKARAELGDAFDIRDFHEVVIGAGSMPMPLLTRRVNAYIEAAK